MPLKIVPTNIILVDLGMEPNGDVQKFFTNTCYKAMDKYVPKDVGNLRKVVTLRSNSITYESPYARYQYFGVREDGTHEVVAYTTSGTGPYWDSRMITADGEKVKQQVEKYINRRAK